MTYRQLPTVPLSEFAAALGYPLAIVQRWAESGELRGVVKIPRVEYRVMRDLLRQAETGTFPLDGLSLPEYQEI